MSLPTENEPQNSGYPLTFMRPQRFGHFCNRCNNFDIYSFKRDSFGLRGYKYSDAEETASSGCPFCSILVGAFQDKLRSPAPRSLRTSWEKHYWIHFRLNMVGASTQQDTESGGSGLGVSVMQATLAPQKNTLPTDTVRESPLPAGWPGRKFPSLDFHMAADSGTQAAINRDICGRYPGENILSEDYTRMIFGWLQNCLSHPKCCQTMSGSKSIIAIQAPLPTRCVEILERGFRLSETGSELGAYITLSHRWMTPETALCSTTTGNIQSRKETGGNWWRDLPKVFLDTLDLARRLRVKYVWIDSLCIIQKGDGGFDWQQEALRMADYYQYALFTVAATSGSKDHGLIPQRIIMPPRLARLPYRDSKGSRHGYFYVYSYNWEVNRQYLSFIRDSELLSRGWVFQEWLLSRRILYFTPAGLFFECQEQPPYNDRSETSQIMSDDETAAEAQTSLKNSFILEAAVINPLWYRIVESYSTLSLTKPDDRIVALAGISKEFREALMRTTPGKGNVAATVSSGINFVSGLWLPDLHYGLLWERNSSGCEPHRVPNFPTWSWSSILSPVVWDGGQSTARVQPEAQLVAVATSEDDVYPLDSLRPIEGSGLSPLEVFGVDNKFASLYMRGKSLQVVVRQRFNNDRELEIAATVSGHSGNSDNSAWRAVCSGLLPAEIAGWASFDYPEHQDDAFFEHGHEMCVFHISTASKVPGGFGLGYITPWHPVFNVLFIENIGGQKYKRLGVGRLFGKEFGKQFGTATVQYVELK